MIFERNMSKTGQRFDEVLPNSPKGFSVTSFTRFQPDRRNVVEWQRKEIDGIPKMQMADGENEVRVPFKQSIGEERLQHHKGDGISAIIRVEGKWKRSPR